MDMGTANPGLVVVGVNDSPAGRRAVEAGAREAAMHHCRLELVHAFNWIPKPEPPAAREAMIRRAITDARRVAPGVPVETRWLEGPAVDALLRRSRSASLTVIGDGDVLTSTCLPRDALTVQVAARAAGTVLVTRARPATGGPVVVGVNGSDASARALEFAFGAAACRQAPLVVVRAYDSSAGEHARPPAVGALERRYALRAEIRLVDGSADTALCLAAQDAGLVVVGPRGRHPYSGLLGWVAQSVLHHSPAPVALVRSLLPDGCDLDVA
jgi:nucleotide-binding universal stress UspA family protein